MYPILVTPPTVEPVDLEDAKSHCRVSFDAEDDLFTAWIEAARQYFEDQTGLTLHESTWEVRLSCWPIGPFSLPRAAPLWRDPSTGEPSVEVYYKDSDGVETQWTDFVVSAPPQSTTWKRIPPATIATAYGESFPSFTAYPVDPIRIRYKAGLANASPQVYPSGAVQLAIKMLIAGFNENRESEVITEKSAVQAISMQYGVDAIINAHKVSYAF